MTVIALGWPQSLLDNNILWKNLIKLSNTSTSTVKENVTFIFPIKKKILKPLSNYFKYVNCTSPNKVDIYNMNWIFRTLFSGMTPSASA